MSLHKHFPVSPYALLDPQERWFPAAEEMRATAYEKLIPPLVANIRIEVKAWRDAGSGGQGNPAFPLHQYRRARN